MLMVQEQVKISVDSCTKKAEQMTNNVGKISTVPQECLYICRADRHPVTLAHHILPNCHDILTDITLIHPNRW